MPASVHEDQDQSMVDVDAQQENGEVIEVGENRITIVCNIPSPRSQNNHKKRGVPDRLVIKLSGAIDTAASFQFKEEGHTLGNALRYVIMKKYAPPFHNLSSSDIMLTLFKAPKSNSAATQSRIRQRPR